VGDEKIRGRLADLPELRRALSDMLNTQNFGVLCTQSRGQPYGTVVCFAQSEDLARLWFATTRSTRKFADIMANDRVAFVVNNAANKPSDVFDALAATGTGQVRELSGADREAALNPYLAKHPHLEGFVTSPNCALVELSVEVYHVVTRFQEVVEVHLA
jgi:uncharacterized protein YhbP (UPF0306 family)